MQGHQFYPWSQKIPQAGATKPVRHNYRRLHTLEPVLCSKRSHCSETPTHRNSRVAPLIATREHLCSETKTQRSQKKKIKHTHTLNKIISFSRSDNRKIPWTLSSPFKIISVALWNEVTLQIPNLCGSEFRATLEGPQAGVLGNSSPRQNLLFFLFFSLWHIFFLPPCPLVSEYLDKFLLVFG